MSDLKFYAVNGDELSALPVPKTAHEVHDLFDKAPLGVYSALRSYGGYRFLRLDAHLSRCRTGIERAGWTTHFDFEGLRRAIDRVARAYGSGDVRLRFDLLERPFEHDTISTQVLLAVQPQTPVPEAVLQNGARLALAPEGLQRRAPLIKYTDWVLERRVCQKDGPAADEHLLVDPAGQILEGVSSNFYAISKGTLITAGDGVLEGITRQIVLELAQRRGVRVEYSRLPLAELGRCDEACISSATREVVPVTVVADKPVGTGKPGPVVAGLRAAYLDYAAANAIPAIAH